MRNAELAIIRLQYWHDNHAPRSLRRLTWLWIVDYTFYSTEDMGENLFRSPDEGEAVMAPGNLASSCNMLCKFQCGFVVYTTDASCFGVPCRALCPRVYTFLLALWSPQLGKMGLVYVLLVCLFVCFSSSWCQWLAAVCDCGTPWTFLLTFLDGTVWKF